MIPHISEMELAYSGLVAQRNGIESNNGTVWYADNVQRRVSNAFDFGGRGNGKIEYQADRKSVV